MHSARKHQLSWKNQDMGKKQGETSETKSWEMHLGAFQPKMMNWEHTEQTFGVFLALGSFLLIHQRFY